MRGSRVWDPLDGLRSASVYKRGGTLIVSSSRRAGYGPNFPNPPFTALPVDAADSHLGETVTAAIDAHVVLKDIPSDRNRDKVGRGLLEAAGVRDDRMFDRGALLVVIQEQHGAWSVQPWRRDRGMFFPLRDEFFIELQHPEATEIGAAVKRSFARLLGKAT